MADTAFAEHLEETPIGRVSRFYMAGLAALRKRNGNTFAAQRELADVASNDLNFIRELFAKTGDSLRDEIEKRTLIYIKQIQKDQSGIALNRNEAVQTMDAQKSLRTSASASFHRPIEPIWTPEDIVPPVRADREEAGRGRSADGLIPTAQLPRETKSTNDGKGALSAHAPSHTRLAPAPSPELARGGHRELATSGQRIDATSRENRRFRPGHARHGSASIAAMQPVMAETLLDTYRVRDGRLLRTIPLKDLPGLIAANRKEAVILDRIRNHTANGGPTQMVHEIISAESFETFVADAEEAARATL